LILEQRSTQILVVADSPAQDRRVNQRLETELTRLRADYHLTDPIAIRGPRSPGRESTSSASYSVRTG
jgi:hypothetical protein